MPLFTRRCTFFIVILLTSFLSACGFHLRGAGPEGTKELPFDKVYIQTSQPYSTFGKSLRDALQYANVKVVNNPDDTPYTLVIMSTNFREHEQAVGGNAQIRQFIMYYTVNYQMLDAKGRVLLPVQTIEVPPRNIEIQADQMLASSDQKTTTQNQMQETAVRMLLMQLSSPEATAKLKSQQKITTNAAKQPRAKSAQ